METIRINLDMMTTTMARKILKQFSYNSRIRHEHFGSRKYRTTGQAIGELVANAFDAEAKRVEIALDEDGWGYVRSIKVEDDGHGLAEQDLDLKFMVAGTSVSSRSQRATFGRFGVGRFAVYRIGDLSKWSSVAWSEPVGSLRKIQFEFRSDVSGDQLEVIETEVGEDTPTGTVIEIFNLLDKDSEKLAAPTIRNSLRRQFCGYLLAHPNKELIVAGERIEADTVTSELEAVPDSERIPGGAELTHLVLHDRAGRLEDNVLFTSKGRTITGVSSDRLMPNYLCLVSAPCIDKIVASDNAGFIDSEMPFKALRDHAVTSAESYNKRWRYNER
ncbi:MAG TPA: ATP-binding protein, partial [Acidobacteriota bacterium]|nr:ATP-binding protein [Acidobacteriota bacterium]